MINNRSMPHSTIIPVLGYNDVPQAVDWLTRVFGFTERLRIADHRVQLTYGSGDLVVMKSAASGGTASHSIMVRVTDVDAHYLQSKQAGAQIVGEPATFPYGERQYTVADLGGQVWTFSQSVADVDPRSWGGTLVSEQRNQRVQATRSKQRAAEAAR
jgi:uncharacterized glyoxalase superfamily protein PhnB